VSVVRRVLRAISFTHPLTLLPTGLHPGSSSNSIKALKTKESQITNEWRVISYRLLYWTEKQSDGKGRLMKCRLDGSNLRTVLGRQRRSSRSVSSPDSSSSSSCSCPDLSVVSSFAVDYTLPVSQLPVFVADSDTGDIWATDTAGCHCQLIVNATTLSLTPSDIGQCIVLILHLP